METESDAVIDSGTKSDEVISLKTGSDTVIDSETKWGKVISSKNWWCAATCSKAEKDGIKSWKAGPGKVFHREAKSDEVFHSKSDEVSHSGTESDGSDIQLSYMVLVVCSFQSDRLALVLLYMMRLNSLRSG